MDVSREEYRRFHARRRETLLALLERHVPEPVERCLDIGGGGDAADLLDALAERFARELHTVDLRTDLEELRRRGVHAETCNVDTQPLPYPDAHFDLILFASLIEHLYSPAFAVAEMARVLRPGGVLVVEAPNAVALGRRLDALAGDNPFRWFNRYNALEGKALMEYCAVFYTPEEVTALLDPGFEALERRYGMHDPPAGMVKRVLRELAFRLNPRFGDCFFIVARRRAV